VDVPKGCAIVAVILIGLLIIAILIGQASRSNVPPPSHPPPAASSTSTSPALQPTPNTSTAGTTEPSATPTGSSETPQGTTLGPGEAWSQNNWDLKLTSFKVEYPHELLIDLTLTNRATGQRGITITGANFSAKDNLKQLVHVCGSLRAVPWVSRCALEETMKLINPGEERPLDVNCSSFVVGTADCEDFSLIGDWTDTRVAYVDFTVSGIGGITDAKWQILIPHSPH
jgi:hypothetical protein